MEAKVENGKYTKDYLITSFDTGINAISPIRFMTISGSDTNEFTTSELYLKVNPYILIDTIPRDTVFAENAGTVLFGKDGFSKEIEQYIPDSIKQSMSADHPRLHQAVDERRHPADAPRGNKAPDDTAVRFAGNADRFHQPRAD